MKIVFRQLNKGQEVSLTHDCRKAFTLIEILIVLALTTLLFALLLIPLVSAINYTRQAQSLTAAQDAARITRERLTRELSSAAYVFDNTSHPFVVPTGTTVAAGDDLFTNFLDLDIPTSTAGTTVPAHAYNTKLDFALPRRNDSGLPVDPTTGEPITFSQSGSGSAVIVSPSQVFPAAAGITMVRYWIGLQNPEQANSYNNPREGSATSADTNTYILYRAQFQPYQKDTATGKYVADTNLFATKADGVTPELDDPDFFRQVSTNDINWLNDTHAHYTAGEVTDHNTRLDHWISIAKPVIPGPNVDLILLPHNADNTLAYDTTGQFTGVAHSGTVHDPITDTLFPVVNTSVTFKPGTVSGDATPATTTEDIGAGVPLVAGNTGVSFIPTVYTASAQSWSLPYTVTLAPPSAPAGQVAGGATYTITQDPVTGDTLEYDSSGTGVYDLTKAIPLGSATSYIPVGITADNGTINFDTPSFPNGPANPIAREWVYTPTGPDALGNYQIDLKVSGGNTGSSPLGTIKDPSASTILTARIVPGTVHVYGPDATPGPGRYVPGSPSATPLVLYTEASQGSVGGDNQYRVDYANSVIEFLGNADQFGDAVNPAPVKVVYDYQSNMAPVGTGPLNATGDYTLTPMNVSVNYKTRDLIDISLGVRIYDLSTGRAQVIPSEFKAKIGNSNR